MAGKRIERDELIDITGLKQGLAEFAAQYMSDINAMRGMNGELLKSSQGITNELIQLKKAAQTGGGEALQAIAERAAELKPQLQNVNAGMATLSATEKQLEAVTGGLIARQQALLTQYEQTNGQTRADISLRNRLAKEMVALQNQFDRLSKTTKGAGDAARDLSKTYAGMSRELAESRKALKNLDNAFDLTTGKLNRTNAEAVALATTINRLDTAVKTADRGMGQFGRNVGAYPNTLNAVSTSLANMALRFLSIEAAISAVTFFVTTTAQLERLDVGLKAVTSSEGDYARSQAFLTELADKLGLRYDSLIKSYKALKAATNDTVLEGEEMRHMFEAVTSAGARLQLSSEEVQGTLYALTQMISKGKVQAEELRQQLGERLPGAMKLMADATGLTERELNKLMEKGELMAVDVLPKFADQLEKVYGVGAYEKIQTMSAGWNRLTNQAQQFIKAFNDNGKVNSFFATIANGLASTLQVLTSLIKSDSWAIFFGALRGDVGPAIMQSRLNEAAERATELDRANFLKVSGEQRLAIIAEQGRKEAKLREELRSLKYEQRSLSTDGERETNRAEQANTERLIKIAQKRTAYLLKLSKEADDEAIRLSKAKNKQKVESDEMAAELAAKANEKANQLAEAARREGLALERSRLAEELSLLAQKREDGLVTEQEFLSQRLKLTQQSVARELALVRGNGADEQKLRNDINRQKLDAERQYKKDLLKLNEDNSERRTLERMTKINVDREDGLITEAEFIIRRRDITVHGLEERKSILEEAGKSESDAYRKLNEEINAANEKYNRDRNRLQEQAFSEAVRATKDAIVSMAGEYGSDLSAALSDIEVAYEQARTAIELSMARRQISEAEGERQLHALKLGYLHDVEQLTVASSDMQERAVLDRIAALKEQGKTEKQILAILQLEQEALEKLEKQNDKARVKRKIDEAQEIADAQIKAAQIAAQAREQLEQKLWEGASVAIASFFAISDQFRQAEMDKNGRDQDTELKALDRKTELGLLSKEQSESQKANIEQRYASKDLELRRKQAKSEKAQAAFSIILSTAQAIMKTFAQFGVPVGIPLALTQGAIGALQLGVVLARPLPEFYTGTQDAPEGYAHVAERGYEIRQTKVNGKTTYELLAEKQVKYLNTHDRIYTHEESRRMLETNTTLAREVRTAPGGVNYTSVTNTVRALTKSDMRDVMADAMANLTIHESTIQNGELKQFVRKKGQQTEWLNEYFSLPR